MPDYQTPKVRPWVTNLSTPEAPRARWSRNPGMTGNISARGMWAGSPVTGFGLAGFGAAAKLASRLYAGAALEKRIEEVVAPEAAAARSGGGPRGASAAPPDPKKTRRPGAPGKGVAASPAGSGTRSGYRLTDVHTPGSRMGAAPKAALPRRTPIDAESWEATDGTPAPAWSHTDARRSRPMLALPAPTRGQAQQQPRGPFADVKMGGVDADAGPEHIDLRTPAGRAAWAAKNVNGTTPIKLKG